MSAMFGNGSKVGAILTSPLIQSSLLAEAQPLSGDQHRDAADLSDTS